jgi:LytS/YehU family sensor histidine kinase
MVFSSFTALFFNATFLISLGIIYDVLNLQSIKNKTVRDLITDLSVGILGLAVMNTSWEMAPGLFFDTRWILISLCGLFFGFVPTLLAAAIMVSLRLYIGGTGTLVGALVVIIPGCLGYLLAYISKQKTDA